MGYTVTLVRLGHARDADKHDSYVRRSLSHGSWGTHERDAAAAACSAKAQA